MFVTANVEVCIKFLVHVVSVCYELLLIHQTGKLNARLNIQKKKTVKITTNRFVKEF